MRIPLILLPFFLALASNQAFAEPMARFVLESALKSNSPCILAGHQRNAGVDAQVDSVVFCITGRYEGKREKCVLTGYDAIKDVFTSQLKIEDSVAKACLKGGVEALLEKPVGKRSIRKILREKFVLDFSADRKFTESYYPELNDPEAAHDLTPDIRKRKSKPSASVEEAPSPTGSGPVSAGPGQGGMGGTGAAAPGGGSSSKDIPRNGSFEKGNDLPQLASEPDFIKVKVFYASDRKWTDQAKQYPALAFNDDRNDAKELQLGVAEVSIPLVHQKGLLEEPSVFSFKTEYSPSKHVMVLKVEPRDTREFFTSIRDRVSQSKKREMFVFVHGYNNSFADSIRRTAQLAYDLNFDGAPISYTWPSGDSVWKYSMAEANAEWTFRHLKRFLEQVARESGAERIHLIAHSMGNRVLANAITQLRLNTQKPFHQIVLAAPDIDTETFSQIEEQIAESAERVTVYASKNDSALSASKKFHSYPRLGQGGDDVFTSKFVETVDISLADESGMGHSYYGDNTQVLTDLGLILRQNEAARNRPGLLEKALKQLPYWQMQKVLPK